MKVITVSLSQVIQLQQAQKNFILLAMGSWNMKSSTKFVRTIHEGLGVGSYVLFRLTVDINSEEEDFLVNVLRLGTLPSLIYYKRGEISKIEELDSKTGFMEMRHASLEQEELVKYTPKRLENDHASINTGKIGKLFLSGDRSSVGKSSMCLAILVSLLKRGVHPSALAYIKPVTQCEAEQPVTQFCNRVGIVNRGIGPVVFYKGFTRAYLNGEAGTSESMLNEVDQAVNEISRGKSFVLIDGVGYPSVGSICNISNADVAQKLGAPVLMIGKSGVGDAVDSYNLNTAFFELKGVRVLGGIFNKLPFDGYYSLENCKEAVTQYFTQFKRNQRPYGFVPVANALPDSATAVTTTTATTTTTSTAADSNSSNGNNMSVSGPVSGTITSTGSSMEVDNLLNHSVGSESDTFTFTPFESAISEVFMKHVDMDRLLHDVWMDELTRNVEEISTTPSFLQAVPIYTPISAIHTPAATNTNTHPSTTIGTIPAHPITLISHSDSTTIDGAVAASTQPPLSQSTGVACSAVSGVVGVTAVTTGSKRSREEVELEARRKGAKGG